MLKPSFLSTSRSYFIASSDGVNFIGYQTADEGGNFGAQRDSGPRLAISQGSRAQVIDGLILSPTALDRADVLARTNETPMVLVGERVYDVPYDHIAIDNVAALSETLAAELSGTAVRVTVLCPTFVKTNIVESGRISQESSELAVKLMRWFQRYSSSR